jgi:uncharacterized protein with HEPN domain
VNRGAGDRFTDILAAIERCRRYQERLADPDPTTVDMARDAILRNLFQGRGCTSPNSPDIVISRRWR